MKKLILPLLLLFAIAHQGISQSYDTAFGLRLGTDWGLTVKQRFAKKATFEGIIQSSLKREEVLITALAEQHFPLLTRRFNVYSGAGLHKGWNTGNDEVYEDPFGITLIAGAEFTLGRLNISWDFKPALNVSGGDKTFYSQSGISVRYVIAKRKMNLFNRDKKKKKRRKKQEKKFNWKFWEKD